jgi:hypothetical protein
LLTLVACIEPPQRSEGAEQSSASEIVEAPGPAAAPARQEPGGPQAICEHMVGLLGAHFGGGGDPQPMIDKCVTKAKARLAKQGPEAFAELADCVLAAQDLPALEACGY